MSVLWLTAFLVPGNVNDSSPRLSILWGKDHNLIEKGERCMIITDCNGKCELEVLVSTFGEEGLMRLSRMALPEAQGVRYLVSCQCPGHTALPIPDKLIREDLKVIFTPTKGLSVNRNNAIDHATAPLCFIADDDISFTPESFHTIISTFRENPAIDIATFKHLGPNGSVEKNYPSHSFPLTHPAKGYYVTSFEIVFRRKPIVESGIRFNENFGLGTPRFGSGEEELWIHDLLESGIKGQFFPYFIATHNDSNTTGIRLMASPSVLRAQGAVITRLYPYTSLLRVILKAWRSSKATQASISSCLRPILYGWWVATTQPRKLFGSRQHTH